LSLCYSNTISIIIGKLKNDYGSLVVTLFFVAASLLGFLCTQKEGVIKENGASITPFSMAQAADIASITSDNASLNAPPGGSLSTTTAENIDSFALFAPEFLSLGEVKDPGTFTNSQFNHPGIVSYKQQPSQSDDRGVAIVYSSIIF